MRRMPFQLSPSIIVLSVLLMLAGCATNPVTGKSDFNLVSEQQELAMGAQQFSPLRQAQGGDYVVDPQLNAYVNEVGQKLAAVSDRPLPYEFKVLNNSVPNAWALPGGKIVINRGLLTELHSESELAAVLGHEITHAAARHGAQSMSRGMLLQGAIAGVALATRNSSTGDVAQLGAAVGAQLVSQRFGRDAEREADYYGMLYMSRAGYDPHGAVELQKTFVKLSEGRQQDWLNGLFASHPPSPERVHNNELRLADLPQGGVVGVKAYQQHTAHLMQTRPAYEAYDKAEKAWKEGDRARAQSLLTQAIRGEPKESRFYDLQGDMAQERGQTAAASTAYNKAISLNPNFFYSYLQRGKLFEQSNPTAARKDLNRSLQMLPTADAYLALGNIARNGGQLVQAKEYYAKAAASDTPVGKQAFGSLVDLDLPSNPGRYIQVQAGLSGPNLIAHIINPTPRNISDIVLLVQYPLNGQLVQVQRQLHGVLASRTRATVDLGLANLTEEQLQGMQVGIIKAQVSP